MTVKEQSEVKVMQCGQCRVHEGLDPVEWLKWAALKVVFLCR